MGHRGSVAEFAPAPVRLLDQFARAVDLAQLPHGHGEDGHHHGASGVVEAFLCLPVALSVASLERPLAMDPRLEEIAGLVAGERKAAAGDAGFHDPTRVLRFFQEAQFQLPRRPQFASQVGQGPLKVARREAVRQSCRSWP